MKSKVTAGHEIEREAEVETKLNGKKKESINAPKKSHEQTTKTSIAYGNSHLACE